MLWRILVAIVVGLLVCPCPSQDVSVVGLWTPRSLAVCVPSVWRMSRHHARRLAGCLLAAALLLLGAPGAPPVSASCPVDCPSVATVPGGYVGSLLLPPASHVQPSSLRSSAASCDGCVWTLEPACRLGDAMCVGAARSCPSGSIRVALWLQRPRDPAPVRVGTFCDDPTVALQPAVLVPGVRDRFVRLVPQLRPSAQPPGGSLVDLPVVLTSGQPRTLGRHRFVLAGRTVQLEADARWTWDLGDGGRIVTSEPGGPWPNMSVTHAYVRSGRYAIRVTTRWQGRFWVDGVGPFVVTGRPVTQQRVVVVRVGTARAVLVAPP